MKLFYWLSLVLLSGSTFATVFEPQANGYRPAPSALVPEKPRPMVVDTTPRPALRPVPIGHGIVAIHTSAQRVAPLEIVTRSGSNYFAKLVDAKTNRPVMEFYITGGRRFETEVPIGTFRLKYAAGKTWFGPDARFGPDTRYSEADEDFRFTFDGYSYSGYTVTLIMQQNGNLDTRRIGAEQF